MSANATPRGWIEIDDAVIRLDQVVAVQDGHGSFEMFSMIVLVGGATVNVQTSRIPANFLTLVAKSKLRSAE